MTDPDNILKRMESVFGRDKVAKLDFKPWASEPAELSLRLNAVFHFSLLLDKTARQLEAAAKAGSSSAKQKLFAELWGDLSQAWREISIAVKRLLRYFPSQWIEKHLPDAWNIRLWLKSLADFLSADGQIHLKPPKRPGGRQRLSDKQIRAVTALAFQGAANAPKGLSRTLKELMRKNILTGNGETAKNAAAARSAWDVYTKQGYK